MEFTNIIEADKKYYMNTFGERFNVCFSHGKGIYVWDIYGNQYIDFLSGIAVLSLGHSHPKLINAIKEQAEKIMHCSNLYYIKEQAYLSKLLVENSCLDKVFFANSGAEANEAAIKLARIYHYKKGNQNKIEIITFSNSFHGRTLATLAATGQEKFHKPFEPLIEKFCYAKFNDIDSVLSLLNSNTCAIMLEPIQGEGGIHVASLDFLQKIKEICEKNDIILIFDEIQCGLGRTGKLFAYENYSIEPDILTLAKGLGGGFPIGAVMAKNNIAQSFEPGDHGSTFGGNPLACAASLAVVSTIFEDKLCDNASEIGKYIIDKLFKIKANNSIIKDIRGKGLMIGIELNSPEAKNIAKKCLKKGLLIGTAGNSVLRLLPPLIVSKENVNEMIQILSECIN